MGILVYVLGKSGTGKSYSMRNFPHNELALINVQGKILPFRGSAKIEQRTMDDSSEIVETLKDYAENFKSIVIDDYQYIMANEFMRRSFEKGYDKFTEIGRHAWDIPDAVRELPNDCIVYIMCHTDRDEEGFEKIKTIGKLLDEKICLEGMSTIVLKTNVTDGKYVFLTQNNGKDTTKSPAGMFPSYAIDNDLKYVDDKIRNYYGFDGAKTDEEMKSEDNAVKTDVQKEERRSRRSRRAEKKEDNFELNDIEIPDDDALPFTGGVTREELLKRFGDIQPNSDDPNDTPLSNADPNTGEAEPDVKEEPRRRRRKERT